VCVRQTFSPRGMGVASGLATYVDVANLPAYTQRELDYHDLCSTEWLGPILSNSFIERDDRDEMTFYGFWGACFNKVRHGATKDNKLQQQQTIW
jgi:hypothetical protein